MTKQSMKKALDALENEAKLRVIESAPIPQMTEAAIAELRAALDAPVEPVAWTVAEMDSVITNDDKQTNAIQFSQRYLDMHDIPLFNTPPDTEGLRRDAERYRWLRDGNDAKHSKAMTIATKHFGIEWDDLIDAAIAAQGGNV
jgi:hypothetical protein